MLCELGGRISGESDFAPITWRCVSTGIVRSFPFAVVVVAMSIFASNVSCAMSFAIASFTTVCGSSAVQDESITHERTSVAQMISDIIFFINFSLLICGMTDTYVIIPLYSIYVK